MEPLVDLLSLYKPVPGTQVPRMVISLEGGYLFADRKVTDKLQRAAMNRLFKRMTRMNIVKIDVWRWVTIK